MTIQDFHKGMRDHFNVTHPGEYLDQLYLLQKEVKIDLMKFDDFLHLQFGEYEARCNLNMGEVVDLKYGTMARKFLASLL